MSWKTIARIVAVVPFILGCLVLMVWGYHAVKWTYWRSREYSALPGYVQLSAKCEPYWNDATNQYPYGPLGFRCDFRTLDDYINLGDELKRESTHQN